MNSIKKKVLAFYIGSKKRGLRRCLVWLFTNMSKFSIEKDIKSDVPWQVKPVGELVFLLSALHKAGFSSKETERLSSFCIDETKTFDWHELSAYDPSIVTVIFSLHEFYNIKGCQIPWESDYIKMLRQISFFEAMDRVPYREMDHIHSLSLIDKDVDLTELIQWFDDTSFGQNQNIARYTIDDMYSLTHALFYITNMGTRPVTALLKEEVISRIHQVLISLAVSIARADNTDVLGEVLLCWIYTDVAKNERNAMIFDSLLRHILKFQTKRGAIAPNLRTFNRNQGHEENFFDLYHTTLVSTLLLVNVHKWDKRVTL
ncbi:DUF6895 family protein [Idiomarina sp. HP20-50]|uniref:DUF6895 family protein n=1 Tax=Idiomarina sp. HP20-50 TaxID=3070813 RepID=UPI00294ACCC7|nr:hypothetical protein [Idiomarina sp. HP20-50]MDV6316269.1 hypothetical protein [Idiomarina sp. HP20-50]